MLNANIVTINVLRIIVCFNYRLSWFMTPLRIITSSSRFSIQVGSWELTVLWIMEMIFSRSEQHISQLHLIAQLKLFQSGIESATLLTNQSAWLRILTNHILGINWPFIPASSSADEKHYIRTVLIWSDGVASENHNVGFNLSIIFITLNCHSWTVMFYTNHWFWSKKFPTNSSINHQHT